MEGSIRKRSKSSWELCIELGRDAIGGRRRRFLNVKGTKAEAQRRLRELLAQQDKGLLLQPMKVTVGEYLGQWLRDYAVPNTRPRTSESYRVVIRRHLVPALGHIPLARLQAADIQALEAKLLEEGKSPRTVQHGHRVLSEALKHGMRWGLIYRNPADAVSVPKQRPREATIPDRAGVAKLLDAAQETPHCALFRFLAYTGCRRGEALGLRWRDVDLDRSTVSIVQTAQRLAGRGTIMQPPKSAKGRRAIVLDPETVAVLRTHRAKQAEHRLRLGEAFEDWDLVFAGPLGGPIDQSVVSRTFDRLKKEVGLTAVRLHDLRHFHATLLLKEGIHPKVVQERLGHATISITLDTYSHVLPGLQERAADAFASAMRG